MPKISPDDQRKAVETYFPGWRMVERPAGDAPRPEPPAEAHSPDLSELRRKFLGRRATDGVRRAPASAAAATAVRAGADGNADDGSAAARSSAAGATEDTVVTIAAENAYDATIGAPGEKKIVLSGEDHKPKLAQG